ncbi:MAG: APC family permease [Chloroflexota bacterium]|nr:APC family permease [Chloroflexota bacterium]
MADEGDRMDRADRRGSGEHEASSLEERTTRPGALPGNRYVRIVRPKEFRRGLGGTYVATDEALRSPSAAGRAYDVLRHILFGRPISTELELSERLSVPTGLGVLATDNISSSAYSIEEVMRVLALAGTGALFLTMPIGIAIIVVLGIVIISQTQVIRTYPGGGGSYAVAKHELGTLPGLVVAGSLLIDYVLTVAVSTAAGVDAIGSFVQPVYQHRVFFGVALIALIMLGNLRGVREAGLIFAGPTYVYLLAMLGLILFGAFHIFSGTMPPTAVPPAPFPATGTEALGVFLILRAFASGCAALTGAEAVANGTPTLRPPEARNGVITVLLMGSVYGVVLLGLTFLAAQTHALPDAKEQETIMSVVTRTFVGTGPYYYLVQVSTSLLLILAANTGFTGFPRLASVLADDRFMPRQFSFRGERLAFSVGIVALAIAAGLVLAAFGGSVTNLIPLYTIGVFMAFTLAQSGLVRRWWVRHERGWHWRIAISAIGAFATGATLLIVAFTKFEYGAWMVIVTLPLLVVLLLSIHAHYRSVADALVIEDPDRAQLQVATPIVLVPIARLDLSSLRALAFAVAVSPLVRAVHVATSKESAAAFRARWDSWSGRHLKDGREIPLDVIESPYRALIQPLLKYIDRIDERDPRPITVVLAEFIPRHWWELILHSQTAFRLRWALLFRPNTIVIDVPYHFASVGHQEEPLGREA